MHVTNVGIDGMMCGQCKSHVSSLLSKIKGALTVKADPFKNLLAGLDFERAGRGSAQRIGLPRFEL